MNARFPGLWLHRFPTAFGRMALLWTYQASRPRIRRILLPQSKFNEWPGMVQDLGSGACPAVSALARKIARFLTGRPVSFDLSLLELKRCRPFQMKVLLAEYGIPRGLISTYARIALHVGHPAAFRAVGSALAKNPFPIANPATGPCAPTCRLAVIRAGWS